MGGYRNNSNGLFYYEGTYGFFWSNSLNGLSSRFLAFSSSTAYIENDIRGIAFAVRCIKDTDPVGSLGSLNCPGATITGSLTEGFVANGVSASVPYTGGNGGSHEGQTVGSTGITGLTAYLYPGVFNNGAGNLIYYISGTPVGHGTSAFALNIGGQSCSLEIQVAVPPFICGTSTETFTYNGSSVTYGTVVSANNECWLDRNLGASQVATSSADSDAYGHLFQWGRLDDGHQVRTSPTTTILSNSDVPGHGNFILAPNSPYDWRSPQNNNLWQGLNGTNNPCPSGYRLPTETEWDTERLSWITNNAAGAFASPLKLTVGGFRHINDGLIYWAGSEGWLWSSTINSTYSRGVYFRSDMSYMSNYNRANGHSVRCIKD
jgi:uncharacterized protein (TIGR02145 family)